jgi:hypothetical protein
MPGNTSATGGYLPQVNAALSDQAIDDAITAVIAGILGISNSLIRPRWQPLPPRQPPPSANWVAMGITERRPMDYPYIRHFNGGPDQLTRWSQATAMVSVYGPGASGLAEQLRDGLYIAQNREALAASGISLTEAGTVTAVPDLFNAQWINRADLELRFAIAIDRQYAVLDIAESTGTITADGGVAVHWDAI